MLTAKYVWKFSTYILAKFECMEDLPATHRNAQASVSLMFLIRHVDKDKINIPEEFEAPNTSMYTKPQKYQELEYSNQLSELHIEFYLQLWISSAALGTQFIVCSVALKFYALDW